MKTIRNSHRLLCTAFALAIIIGQAQGQSSFAIHGTVGPAQHGKVYLTYSALGAPTKDSSTVVAGKFTFHGHIGAPTLATLRFVEEGRPANRQIVDRKNSYRLFLDSGTMEIIALDSLSGATVPDAPLQKEYLAYKEEINRIYGNMRPLNMAYQHHERQMATDSVKKYAALLELEYEKEDDYVMGLVLRNPSSPIALLAVYEYDRPVLNPRPFKVFYDRLDSSLKEMPMGRELARRLDERDLFAAGKKALDFELPDREGRQTQFSAIAGKYILLDFWASWCGPCRLQSPFMKRAYDRFNKKGLEIVAVSLDDSRSRWLKAIDEDQVGDWIHLSDLQGRNSDLAKRYHINGIPHNFLIDSEGTIIAKNLHGLGLEEKLAELLATP